MTTAPGRTLPSVLLVMGVAGAGKSTIGALLAERLGWVFLDGDSVHPPANLDKLRRGIPLDDDDRRDWLQALADWIDAVRHGARHGVLACSALKRAYRRVLIGSRADVRLVYLKGAPALIGQRVEARTGHLMPASLLDDQFHTLEEPGADEAAIVVPVAATPAAIVTSILRALPAD